MHPFVKMLMFLLILLASGLVQLKLLFIMLLVVTVVAVNVAFKAFCSILRRMRWLFLSIFLIYAFGTPGELIPIFPMSLAPSFEGGYLGLLQISRLTVALGALTVLLTTTTRASLMLGFYTLLLPLKYFGLNVEKFSVRLLLTIHYVDEIAIKDNPTFSVRSFNDIHRALESMPNVDVVDFERQAIDWADKVQIVIMLLIFAGLIVMGFV